MNIHAGQIPASYGGPPPAVLGRRSLSWGLSCRVINGRPLDAETAEEHSREVQENVFGLLVTTINSRAVTWPRDLTATVTLLHYTSLTIRCCNFWHCCSIVAVVGLVAWQNR